MPRGTRLAAIAFWLPVLWLGGGEAAASAWAGKFSGSLAGDGAVSTRLCDASPELNARQLDRLLRMTALAKQALDASGMDVALVARNGTNLQRFGIRYSHAAVAMRTHPHGPWAVRQLYYACDEGRPRVFDQGLAGFLSGVDDPDRAHLSMVLLPRAEGEALQKASLDPARALQLLAGRYSAIAHPRSQRFQNCNQWVAELLATAWAPLPSSQRLREQAQDWLSAQGYQPAPVDVGSHALMFVAPFASLIYVHEHPQEDLLNLRIHTSLPSTLEAFVRARVPQAQRIEVCHDTRRVVIHRGWGSIAEGCVPGEGDEISALD